MKVRTQIAFDLGSTRASRPDCGAWPQSSSLDFGGQPILSGKFAMAGAPSPAREARALPRFSRQIIGAVAPLLCLFAVSSCEMSNYAPPVTSAMTRSTLRTTQHPDLEGGRTLFVHRCIECHTLPAIWRYSNEDWPKIVNSMSHRAGLKPADREAVIAYILAVRKQM